MNASNDTPNAANDTSPAAAENALPQTCLPTWDVAELPEPKPLGLRNLAGFIGPGIVMCGIQIGGGEWLFGPAITAKYGGGLMWIATVAILCQVFYNVECGRYALYTGEPVFTGFMRTKPGPGFWVSIAMMLSMGALIPGLSTNAAVLITSMYLDRPPLQAGVAEGDTIQVLHVDSGSVQPVFVGGTTGEDPVASIADTPDGIRLSGTGQVGARLELRTESGRPLYRPDGKPLQVVVADDGTWTADRRDDTFVVNTIAYICLGLVVLPVLMGGKVYNMLQLVMTAKVFIVLGFCLFIGLFFVSWQGWYDVFSGFFKFGNVPVADADGGERVVNAFTHFAEHGEWPLIAVANIAVLGAFAGYAGGGGLSNSTYSNFVRDKGWGMGSQVGAIASAVGGRDVKLSHIGRVFALTDDNLRKWKGWWKYIVTDQFFIWAPGCFMGMALPALLSIEFSGDSVMYGKDVPYSQPLISADGIRHAESLAASTRELLWTVTLFVGLMVFLPSQMAIIDDFSRRWTDIIWSSNQKVRKRMQPHQASRIYYTILTCYVLWSFIAATIFLSFGNAPTLMVTVIANLNNVALGLTAFHVLWLNRNLLPAPLRPKWFNQIGIGSCGVFYFGMAALVFYIKIVPLLSFGNSP